MSRIGAGMLLHGEVLRVDELLARVEAVNRDDSCGGTRVGPSPRTLTVVGPADEYQFDPAVPPPG